MTECEDLVNAILATLESRSLLRYDLLDAFSLSHIGSGLIMGAAAGPHFVAGINSELVANLSAIDGKVLQNGSYCGSYDAKNNLPVSTLSETSLFAMVGQMFLCEGKRGKVIQLTVSGRTREGKFDALLREALASKYAALDRPVGVGGVVVQETGKCLFHVLPEFCAEPLDTPEKLKQWLKFFEMEAPVVAVGTALSHDPQKWKIRLEHFHCFNNDRTKSGHCHFDCDGPTASYTAYLVPGKRLLRVDPPN
ncbi:ester hydrolase C11orf54 homolog [Clonorchis sinensis]|uniref:Ester hydrolase C11orf54 homolog n=1 Tax=Clonorchis sinensis TaxID=79923 RepID=G7YEP6_CLOSI|nr:ester hydrolase C11orf54 homolog [Clonorchis sinensis]